MKYHLADATDGVLLANDDALVAAAHEWVARGLDETRQPHMHYAVWEKLPGKKPQKYPVASINVFRHKTNRRVMLVCLEAHATDLMERLQKELQGDPKFEGFTFELRTPNENDE